MSTPGTLHAVAVALLSELLSRILPSEMHLRVQLPLALGEYDEPFPDVAVVVGNPRDYLQQHPSTAALVVEVAEASLKADREVKGSLYASASIPEYWIVNLRERVVEVHRKPTPDRRAVYGMAYRVQMVLSVGDTVSPLFAPSAAIPIADLLP
ncbi:MAG: Uma2 family endonuclease [Armatimonadota bacterium]|nr:Uma2 family endonuclease [Armatimonadota bacterium]